MNETRLSRTTLSSRLEALRTRHRQIDEEVASEQKQTWRDSTILKRLKRRKLRLKDEIENYEGLLFTLSRGRQPG